MTVKELKEAIADLPDDTPLLVPSCDHSYITGTVYIGDVTYWLEHNHWSEYFGDDAMQEGEKKLQACVVGGW